MAIHKIGNPDYESNSDVILSAARREEVEEIANNLFTAFDWDATAEGREFWDDVWQRLLQIATDGVLK